MKITEQQLRNLISQIITEEEWKKESMSKNEIRSESTIIKASGIILFLSGLVNLITLSNADIKLAKDNYESNTEVRQVVDAVLKASIVEKIINFDKSKIDLNRP